MSGYKYPKAKAKEDEDIEYNEDLASFFVQNLNKPFPKAQILRTYKKPDPTQENMQAQIDGIKKAHGKHLQALYKHQAEQIKTLAKNQHEQYDPENFSSKKTGHIIDTLGTQALTQLFVAERQDLHLHQEDAVSRLRYGHDKMILPLHQQLESLASLEVRRKWIRNLILPKDRTQFEELELQTKLKVARFLMATPEEQENMMYNQTTWTEEASAILRKEFSENPAFAQSVRQLIESTQSRDPRKRATGSSSRRPSLATL